jgi:hypothetical protein
MISIRRDLARKECFDAFVFGMVGLVFLAGALTLALPIWAVVAGATAMEPATPTARAEKPRAASARWTRRWTRSENSGRTS